MSTKEENDLVTERGSVMDMAVPLMEYLSTVSFSPYPGPNCLPSRVIRIWWGFTRQRRDVGERPYRDLSPLFFRVTRLQTQHADGVIRETKFHLYRYV